MKQQTAVEWLINEHFGGFQNCTLDFRNHIEQAKAMEKEQIMKALDRGYDEGCKHPEDISLKNAEQYYNETYSK